MSSYPFVHHPNPVLGMVFNTGHTYTCIGRSLLVTHLRRDIVRVERPVYKVRDTIVEAHEVFVCDTDGNFKNTDVRRGSDSVVRLLKVEIRTAIKFRKKNREAPQGRTKLNTNLGRVQAGARAPLRRTSCCASGSDSSQRSTCLCPRRT